MTHPRLMQNFVSYCERSEHDQVREQEDYAYDDRQEFIWTVTHSWLSLAYRIVGLTIMAGCAALVGWGLSWMVGR
jgi:hypothetical protein